MLIKLKENITLRGHSLTGSAKLTNFFRPEDLSLTDNDGDYTYLTCPDGSPILIKEIEHDQHDERLHIKGRATAGTTITIINAHTDEILIEGIRAREGKWEAKIENVSSTLENITILTSNAMQSTRRSKIVKMPMMLMTINVRRVAGKPNTYLC